MKKIVLSLTISAVLLSSFGTTYAADKDPKDPSAIVKQAFNREFAQVKAVEWTTMGNEGVYQAKFVFNDDRMQAFFAEDGEFLGTTRQIVRSQLPILVVTALEKQYADMHVATIFEYSRKDGIAYYITITGGKGAMILKAVGNGELTVYKRNVH